MLTLASTLYEANLRRPLTIYGDGNVIMDEVLRIFVR